jgi:uncharacterized membrane-anchored protein YhcB (DUF1043 family)
MALQIATLVVSIASLVVSSTIAILVNRVQSRATKEATKEKERLELYDRRFAVYLKTLEFHHALAGPREFFLTEDFRALHRDFIKVARESQYLFDDSSGIHKLLEQLHVEAFKIKAVKENRKELPPELLTRMFEESMAALTIFNDAIPELEKQLKPYLNFQKVLA